MSSLCIEKRDKLTVLALDQEWMDSRDLIKLTLLLMAQKRFCVARKCEYLIDALQTAVYDPFRFIPAGCLKSDRLICPLL